MMASLGYLHGWVGRLGQTEKLCSGFMKSEFVHRALWVVGRCPYMVRDLQSSSAGLFFIPTHSAPFLGKIRRCAGQVSNVIHLVGPIHMSHCKAVCIARA